ncbi:hypothetical protein D3C84_608400 [compost metagenome]
MQVIKHLQGRGLVGRCCCGFVRGAANLLSGFLALAPNDAHGDVIDGFEFGELVLQQRHGTQQCRPGLVSVGQPPAQLEFLGAQGRQAIDRAATHRDVDAIAIGVGELAAHVIGGVAVQVFDQHRGAGLIVILCHAQQARIGLAEGGQVEDVLLGALAEHEVAGGQGVEVVAAEGDFKTIAIGIRFGGLDVGLVAGRVEGDVQRAIAAIAEAEKAQARNIDLVDARGEVINRVGGRDTAGVVVAVAVEHVAVAEGVGTVAAVQRIASGAAVDGVGASAGLDRVVATEAEDQVGTRRAVEGFGIVGAGDGVGGRIGHYQGKAIADRRTGRVRGLDQQVVIAGRGAGRRAGEGQVAGIEAQPRGQGAAIGQGGGVAEAVIVRIGEAGGRHHVAEHGVFGGVLIQQRRGQHRRLVGW